MKKLCFLSIILITVYTHAQWVQRGSDIDGDPFQLRFSELSSDVTGNLIVHNADNGNFVRVWEFSGVDWNLQATIPGVSGESFGSDVSLSSDGTRLAIGAEDRGALGQGGIDIYQYDGANWTQIGNEILGAQNEWIGRKVSISGSGDTVITGGTQFDNGGLLDIGTVKVYKYDGSNWNQIGQTFNGSSDDEELGEDVSINDNGTIIAFSSDNYRDPGTNDPVGLVRVYELQGNSWIQLGDDIISDIDEPIGKSVSLNASGNRIAVGGRTYGLGGVVQVYQFNSGQWQIIGQNVLGEISQESFGHSVQLNDQGNLFVAGAPQLSLGGGIGRTRVYRLDGNTWNKINGDIDGELNFRGFGYSVAINGAGDKIVSCSSTDEFNAEGIIKAYGNDNILGTGHSVTPEIVIYPNPIQNRVHVDFGEYLPEVFIELLDIHGRVLVAEELFNISSVNWNVNLNSGVYFLRIKVKDYEIYNRIIAN